MAVAVSCWRRGFHLSYSDCRCSSACLISGDGKGGAIGRAQRKLSLSERCSWLESDVGDARLDMDEMERLVFRRIVGASKVW